MEEISTKSIDLLCRTCMTSESNDEDAERKIMISIYDTIGLDCPYKVFNEDFKIIILDLIKRTCPLLEIEYNDNLPSLICKICEQKLLELYKFQQNALRVENKLRELIACDTMDPLIENVTGIPVESKLLKMEIMEPLIEFENYEDNGINTPLTDTSDSEWPNEDDSMKVGEVSSKTIKSEGNLVIKVQKKFPCDECDSKLSSLNNLKRHKLIHVKKAEEDSIRNKDKVNSEEIELKSEENQCKISEKEIVTIQEHENAYSSQPSDEDFKSQEMDKTNLIEKAATGDTSNEHNNQTNTENPLACDVCGKTLSSRKSLKRHKLIHTKDLIDGQIKTEESSTKTTDATDKEKSFVCNECGRSLSSSKSLNRHIKIHSKYKEEKKVFPKVVKTTYECEFCQKVFKQSSSLKDHKRVHTGETPYLCSECGRSFNSLSNLKQHLLRHGTEKPYECPDCPLRFPCLSDLCSHKAVHTQIKSHICDICGRGFGKPFLLKKHKMYHNGEKPHKCDYCEMRFVKSDQCQRHMRTHTGEKPYKCKFCVRAFAQSNDLIKHLRTHLGDNVYRCSLCPAGFRLQSELRVHFSSHKNDDEETRASNLKALQEDEIRIQIKFGLMSGLL